MTFGMYIISVYITVISCAVFKEKIVLVMPMPFWVLNGVK